MLLRDVDSVTIVGMKRLLFACLALPLSVFAQGGLPNQPYIYVEGTAETEKPADMVTLGFDLVGRNADLGKANQEVQAKAAKILALLNDRKVAENDVIATDVKSTAHYDEVENSPRKRGKPIGYTVTRGFQVRVRDVAIFPNLVDELISVGAAEFSGINEGLTREKEIKDEIWGKALAKCT